MNSIGASGSLFLAARRPLRSHVAAARRLYAMGPDNMPVVISRPIFPGQLRVRSENYETVTAPSPEGDGITIPQLSNFLERAERNSWYQ